MRITNTVKSDLGLATGQIVPAGRSIEISEEDFEPNKGSKVVQYWFESGKLVGETDDGDPIEADEMESGSSTDDDDDNEDGGATPRRKSRKPRR